MGVVLHSVLESGFEDTARSKEVAWSMEHGAWSTELLDGYSLLHFGSGYLAFCITIYARNRVIGRQLIGFAHWSKGNIDVRGVYVQCMYVSDIKTTQSILGTS